MSPRSSPSSFRGGITLIEILVVLGIIGIIVGMSLPAYTGFARQVRLKTVTRQIVGLILLARSLAIGSHEDHAVVIDLERREVTVVNLGSGHPLDQVVRLPSSLTLDLQVGGEPAEETQFVFHPTGSLAGRSISLVLADQQKRHTIVVTGTTGAVTVQ